MIFDNFESIEISGKKYRLKLTNKGTYEAETKLRHESLMKFYSQLKSRRLRCTMYLCCLLKLLLTATTV